MAIGKRSVQHIEYANLQKISATTGSFDVLKKVKIITDSEKLDLILKHFGNLEKRFDNLETRFGNLEIRFDNLEKRFDNFEKRLDNLVKKNNLKE
ncbi:MAG: hypothetical protein LBT77_02275 [Mycoplasmataceae bacterium]|jgi:chaperonin cofactor prefoldin|nr:hypothetical protein [Mycoplasmataceae bacterium]